MKGKCLCDICGKQQEIEMLLFNDKGTIQIIRMKCGHQRYFKIKEISTEELTIGKNKTEVKHDPEVCKGPLKRGS